ncbi:MAG: DUF3343 domain-containing protein [Clostridia bacterium]|nr:DUF3343 domain-containing protein [Clostridia bacterium]
MYVLVGSVTTAMRFKRLLEQIASAPCDVVHTPSQLHNGGCSYSVRLDNKYLGTAKTISDEYGINIRKIFLDELVGGERIYHAVP